HRFSNSPRSVPPPRPIPRLRASLGVYVTRPFNNPDTIGRAFVESFARIVRQLFAILKSSLRTRPTSLAFRRVAERTAVPRLRTWLADVRARAALRGALRAALPSRSRSRAARAPVQPWRSASQSPGVGPIDRRPGGAAAPRPRTR